MDGTQPASGGAANIGRAGLPRAPRVVAQPSVHFSMRGFMVLFWLMADSPPVATPSTSKSTYLTAAHEHSPKWMILAKLQCASRYVLLHTPGLTGGQRPRSKHAVWRPSGQVGDHTLSSELQLPAIMTESTSATSHDQSSTLGEACRFLDYGRARGAENMVSRGGWLDEILWVVNTEEEDDLRYLEEIIASDPGRHKALYLPGETLSTYTYYKAWQRLDRGKYYVKVDDDIVWIADDAIPRLISQKLDHPECFAVAANVINNPPLGFIHYHIGALHPYLPEVAGPESNIGTTSWKPSLDPFWSGPSDFTWPLHKRPPRQKHRWLRVKEEQMMSQTPAAQLKYEVWGDSYSSWAIAAQMHYSLLENIESDKLGLYKFRPPWDMHGERIRINFICFYADDILNTDISTWPRDRGDEDMIAIDLPKRLHRRKWPVKLLRRLPPLTSNEAIMLIGDALGAHLQYVDQVDLAETDLLTRYQCLARDRGFPSAGRRVIVDFILHVRSPEVCAILNLSWLSDMHAIRDTVLLADERTFSWQSWPPSPVADRTTAQRISADESLTEGRGRASVLRIPEALRGCFCNPELNGFTALPLYKAPLVNLYGDSAAKLPQPAHVQVKDPRITTALAMSTQETRYSMPNANRLSRDAVIEISSNSETDDSSDGDESLPSLSTLTGVYAARLSPAAQQAHGSASGGPTTERDGPARQPILATEGLPVTATTAQSSVANSVQPQPRSSELQRGEKSIAVNAETANASPVAAKSTGPCLHGPRTQVPGMVPGGRRHPARNFGMAEGGPISYAARAYDDTNRVPAASASVAATHPGYPDPASPAGRSGHEAHESRRPAFCPSVTQPGDNQAEGVPNGANGGMDERRLRDYDDAPRYSLRPRRQWPLATSKKEHSNAWASACGRRRPGHQPSSGGRRASDKVKEARKSSKRQAEQDADKVGRTGAQKKRRQNPVPRDVGIFEVDCLLARRGEEEKEQEFLVKWTSEPGRTVTSWEPRHHILDKQMLGHFEAGWQGFDEGVDVLDERGRG
ncbi:hypothetical protein PCL_01204, partial [Purpureocillium lilacinum]